MVCVLLFLNVFKFHSISPIISDDNKGWPEGGGKIELERDETSNGTRKKEKAL